MSESTTPTAAPETPSTETTAPATSMLERVRSEIDAIAKSIGVDVEKIVALVKEHL